MKYLPLMYQTKIESDWGANLFSSILKQSQVVSITWFFVFGGKGNIKMGTVKFFFEITDVKFYKTTLVCMES